MHDDRNDIDRYLRDEMTSRERYLFEKRMLNDPFLADAVEGAQSVGTEAFREDVKSLSQRIRDQRDIAWGMSLRIAAGVVLVFVVGWLAYREDSPDAKREVAVMKGDSTTSGPRDSAKQTLTLAQPKVSERVSGGIASRAPQSIYHAAAPADSTSSTAGSGAVSLSPPVTAPAPTVAQTQADLTEEDETSAKEAAVADRSPRDAAPQGLSLPAGEKKAVHDTMDSTAARVEILEPATARMKKSMGTRPVPASPIGGMDPYRKYLADNRRIPPGAQSAGIHGTAVIAFTIAADGSLTHFIRLSNLGYGCEEEVEHLIQQGPRWNPAKSGNTPVASQAQVSLEF